jgi:hypothetical protein
MSYDTVRLDNYLKENNPSESVFDLLRARFKEYEIIETEKGNNKNSKRQGSNRDCYPKGIYINL